MKEFRKIHIVCVLFILTTAGLSILNVSHANELREKDAELQRLRSSQTDTGTAAVLSTELARLREELQAKESATEEKIQPDLTRFLEAYFNCDSLALSLPERLDGLATRELLEELAPDGGGESLPMPDLEHRTALEILDCYCHPLDGTDAEAFAFCRLDVSSEYGQTSSLLLVRASLTYSAEQECWLVSRFVCDAPAELNPELWKAG